MKMAKAYRISKKGYAVTLYYDDGSKGTVWFENFLKAFGNYYKAVLEYLMYITVASRNEDVARQIRAKLTELLLPRREDDEEGHG